jgi:hypothetical protein
MALVYDNAARGLSEDHTEPHDHSFSGPLNQRPGALVGARPSEWPWVSR